MKIKQKIKRKMAMFFGILMVIQTVLFIEPISTVQAEAGGGSAKDINIVDRGTAEAFKNLTIAFDEKVTSGTGFGFKIAGDLSMEFTKAAYEKFISLGGKTQDNWVADDTHKTYGEYLDAVSDENLSAIGFVLNLDFSEGTWKENKTFHYQMITSEYVSVGELELKVEGKKATLIGKINKRVYSYTDVSFGGSAAADLTYVYQDDTLVTVAPGSDGNDFIITIPEENVADPGSTGFKIKKKADVDTTDWTITYTIDASVTTDTLLLEAATGSEIEKEKTAVDLVASGSETHRSKNRSTSGDLRGQRIVDRIPTDLEIISVEKSSDGTSYHTVNLSDDKNALDGSNYYCDSDGVLTYLIGSDGADESVKNSHLRIKTRVADRKYNEYMLSNNPQGAAWEFTNIAYLKGTDDELSAVSDSVKSTINLPAPFNKNGDIVAGSGGKVEWTLNVSSHFSSNEVKLWTVDHIEDVENMHDYIESEGILVDGVKRGIVKYPNALETQYAYSNLIDVGKINDLLSVLETHPSISGREATDAIIYRYKTGDSKMDAVMLIPIDSNNNKEMKITYRTQTNTTLDGNGVINRELSNEAKVLWKWPDGIGPEGPDGSKEFGTASIDKKVTIILSLITKTAKANAYNSASNEITWTIDVNQMGKTASDVTIEDTLGNGMLSLTQPGSSDGSTLTLNPASGGDAPRQVPYVKPENWPTEGTLPKMDCYTVFEEPDSRKEKLVIFLKNLEAKEHYTFDVKTFVGILDNSGGINNSSISNQITNECKVKATVDGNSVTFTTVAKTPVERTLIGKIAIRDMKNLQWYDYEKHTVNWSVNINPLGWKIKNVQIVDTLPVGTHFAELLEVLWKKDGENRSMALSYIPAAGEILEEGKSQWTDTEPPKGIWKASADGLDIEVRQDPETGQLIAAFPKNYEIDSEFGFRFSSYVEKERRDQFVSWPISKKYDETNPNAIRNKAAFIGEITAENGKTFPVHAGAVAVNIEGPNPMIKKGMYANKQMIMIDGVSREVYAINWTLYVNRLSTDMAGATVTDELRESTDLIPETMKISTVVLDEKGGVKEKSAQQIYPNQESTDQNGFSTLNNRKFEYVIPETYAKNTLMFKFTTMLVDDVPASGMTNKVSLKHGNQIDDTGDVQASGAVDFRSDFYANAEGMCFVTVAKTSTADTGKKPLKGAAFQIYEMTPPDDLADRENITQWRKDMTTVSERTSNAEGKLSFLFLKPDTMYKIVEKTPPEGYEQIKESKFSWYVIPKTTESSTNSYPSNPNQTDKNAKYTVLVNEAKTNYLTFSVENKLEDPTDAGQLQFWKKGENDQILPGVKFMARHGETTYEAMSDQDGLVSFNNLDYLNENEQYTITEQVPFGYKDSNWSVEAKFYKDAAGKARAEFVDPKKTLEMVDGELILRNVPITQDGAFEKVDQNGDPVLGKTVAFKVERRGDGGQLLGRNLDEKPMLCMDVDGDARMKAAGAEGKTHNADQYYDYLPLTDSLLSSDAKGVISFHTLPYGDYRLTEQSGLTDIQIPGTADINAVLYLRINRNGAFASRNAFSKEDLAAWNGKTKLEAENPSGFTVQNSLQYAELQLTKALGVKDGDRLTAVTSGNGAYIPIEGIRFDIYRDDSGNGTLTAGQPTFISNITTNREGNLKFPEGAKKLIVGNYILKEEGGGNYASVTQGIPFTVAAKKLSGGASFTPDRIYIGWDGKNFAVETVSGPSAPSILFLNASGEGQIQGIKTTGDHMTPLSGAVIGLFPAGTTSFTEANLWNGQTALSGADGRYSFQKIPYGTYLVAELSAPLGYNLNTKTRYEVTIMDGSVRTNGFLIDPSGAVSDQESPITIANTKKSSGGGDGGGGGTKPPETTGQGGEVLPSDPAAPQETKPEESSMERLNPGGETVIIPPDTPPGSDFEVKDPNGDTIAQGKTDGNGEVHLDLPPGTYTLITFDDNKVPLSSMVFEVEDNAIPLARLPKAGDHSAPIVLLGVLMLISLSGMAVVLIRKK